MLAKVRTIVASAGAAVRRIVIVVPAPADALTTRTGSPLTTKSGSILTRRPVLLPSKTLSTKSGANLASKAGTLITRKAA